IITDTGNIPGSIQSFVTRGTILVTTADDENDADPYSGSGLSLREALGVANGRPGGSMIRFHPSLSGGIIALGGYTLHVRSDCTIDASDLPERITVVMGPGILVDYGSNAIIRGLNFTGKIGPFAALENNGRADLSDINFTDNNSHNALKSDYRLHM